MTAVWGLLVNVGGFGQFKIFGECWRFRAEHSRIKRMENGGIVKCRGRAFAPIFINYHRNLYLQMLYPLRFYR